MTTSATIPQHAGLFPDGFFGGFFFLALAVVAVPAAIRGVMWLRQWSSDNDAPVENHPARVVAKRQEQVTHHSGTSHSSSTSTTYYVTFECTDSGQRHEFKVPDDEVGLLAEEDAGSLVFQGRRFRQFVRQPASPYLPY